MKKRWHGTLAHYCKNVNTVKERRIEDFSDYESAENWLNDHHEKPVQIWHDNAVALENPYFAMAETESYQREYQKVID